MSRTYRHTKKNSKVIKGFVVGHLNYFYEGDFEQKDKFRNPKKEKEGIILCGNERFHKKLLNGHYNYGIPKSFRQPIKRSVKRKMKQEIERHINNFTEEEIGAVRFIKNAGLQYY